MFYFRLLQVGEKTLLVLPTHILPCNLTEVSPSDKSSTSAGVVHQAYSNLAEQKRDQYAWFDDHCNQVSSSNQHVLITVKQSLRLQETYEIQPLLNLH